jgi:hypothetical protein
MEPDKQCRKCQITKPTSEFYKESKGARSNKSEFRAVCRDCWNGREPPLEFSELKAFAKRFILRHLAEHSEAVDEYFRHRLPYEQPEVTSEAVERAISELIKEAKVKVTRWETAGMYERVNFLALV